MSSSGSLSNNNSNHVTASPMISQRNPSTPRKSPSSRKSSRFTKPVGFSAAMQDKQARNKDPYSSSDESIDVWSSPNGKSTNGYKDTWEQKQKRREAAIILDNPELLMMHAQARLDSVPSTRHHFLALLAGYPPTIHPPKSKPKPKSKSKSKSKSHSTTNSKPTSPSTSNKGKTPSSRHRSSRSGADVDMLQQRRGVESGQGSMADSGADSEDLEDEVEEEDGEMADEEDVDVDVDVDMYDA